jgi:putative oxidoreductase
MDFKNKYLVTTLRVLLGLFMIFSGASGLFAGFSGFQGIPEPMLEFTMVLWNTGIFQMIKVTELVAGLMLVFNFLPALAAIFLAPVAVGVIVVNAMMAPAYLPMGIVFAALNAYLGYVYWPKYKPLFHK